MGKGPAALPLPQKLHPRIGPSGHVTGVPPPNFEILATPLTPITAENICVLYSHCASEVIGCLDNLVSDIMNYYNNSFALLACFSLICFVTSFFVHFSRSSLIFVFISFYMSVTNRLRVCLTVFHSFIHLLSSNCHATSQ